MCDIIIIIIIIIPNRARARVCVCVFLYQNNVFYTQIYNRISIKYKYLLSHETVTVAFTINEK
jgi:hypothetical protein